jgi:hypothetical protein
MSGRTLWALSIPVALVGWAGLFFFTGGIRPTNLALLGFLPLLAITMTMTLAPWVWMVARRLNVRGVGELPSLALRSSLWVGIWTSLAVGSRMARMFNWVVAITVAVVFVLLEGFLQQWRQGDPEQPTET